MVLSLIELREEVRSVVLGDVSLDAFEDWLVSRSWNMHQWAPPEIQRLVGYLELRLAERSSGHLSDEALLSEFGVRLARLDAPSKPIFVSHVSGGASISVVAPPSASELSVQRFAVRVSYDQPKSGVSEGKSGDNSRPFSQPERIATA